MFPFLSVFSSPFIKFWVINYVTIVIHLCVPIVVKLSLSASLVWNLCTNHFVNCFCIHLSESLPFDPNNYVYMGKATFLKLNRVCVRKEFPKHHLAPQVLDKLIFFELEHPGNKVRSIKRTFFVQQIVLNLLPVWVTSHCDEQMRVAKPLT